MSPQDEPERTARFVRRGLEPPTMCPHGLRVPKLELGEQMASAARSELQVLGAVPALLGRQLAGLEAVAEGFGNQKQVSRRNAAEALS